MASTPVKLPEGYVIDPPEGYVLDPPVVPDKPWYKKAWDWTGEGLAKFSKLTQPYVDKQIPFPVNSPMAMFATTPRGVEATTNIGTSPGFMHGVAKAAEGMTSPRSAALMALLGPWGSKLPGGPLSVGLPGFVAGLGLAGDTAARGYQGWKGSETATNPEEKIAGKTEAIADWLMSLAFAKHTLTPEPKPAAPVSRRLPSPRQTSLPIQTSDTGLPMPQNLPVPPRPSPVAAPGPLAALWYENARPEERWWEPRPPERTTEGMPGNIGQILPHERPPEPIAPQRPLGTSNMRMSPVAIGGERSLIQTIQDLGGINPSRIEGAGTSAEWQQGVPDGVRRQVFRKDASHGEDTILRELEEQGFQFDNADQLRSALANPRSRAKGIIRGKNIEQQMADYFEELARKDSMRDEEGNYDYQAAGVREPGEEGFADITPKKRKSSPLGEIVNPENIKHGWIDKEGNIIDIGDAAHNETLLSAARIEGQRFKNMDYEARNRGLIRLADVGDVGIFVAPYTDPTPGQIRALHAIAKVHPLSPLAWEDFRGLPSGRKHGYGMDSFRQRFPTNEEGFADLFPKNPKEDAADYMLNIAGQKPNQAKQDLTNRVLKAPDSNLSKRDMLGLNKKKKSVQSGTPLFENTGGLFK